MFSLATKHNDPEAKLGWGERIGYGTGGFAFNMINGIIGSFLLIYFTNVALLDAAVISTIIAVSKVFDGISDVLVGNIVAHTNAKMGKARTWLFRMCIPFGVSTMLLFFVPPVFPTAVKYIYVFLMYNIVNAVCLTFMLVPYYSMVSLITRNSYEQGFLGTVQQIFQTLGNIVVNSVFVGMLTKFSSSADNIYTQQAYTITMGIFCLVMVLVSMFCVFCTKERVTGSASERKPGSEGGTAGETVGAWTEIKALLKNRYWVIMFFGSFVVFFNVIMYAIGNVYYCQYVFNDMSRYKWMANSISIAQFASMFIIPIIMTKMSKRWIYVIGLALMGIGFAGFSLVGGSVPVMILMNVLKGAGLGLTGGMALGLLADTLKYGTLKTGINSAGKGNAGISAAQKIGLGLGQAVFGWIMAAAGFDAQLDIQGLPQPESVVTAIKFTYSWLPFILTAVVFVLYLVLFNIDGALKKAEADGTSA